MAEPSDAPQPRKWGVVKWKISRRGEVIGTDYEVRGLQVAGATFVEISLVT
jgi:hypothetical protein